MLRVGYEWVKSDSWPPRAGILIGMGSIAVVIPCFNDREMLESAVASAEGQNVAPEIVVVDDRTTDPVTLALALPVNSSRRRMIGSAVAHLAYGNDWRVLVSRYRAHRVLRAA